MTSGLPPPWLQTGNNVFKVGGARSGDAEKDKLWALERISKYWSSYDFTIYTDRLVKDDTEIGG